MTIAEFFATYALPVIAAALTAVAGFVGAQLKKLYEKHIKESPVGQALMGRKAGERVEIEVSPAMKYFVQIRSVEKGSDDESLAISTY